MATLFRGDYPLHWTPNADNIQGDPRGLLRADNLTKEEDGSIQIVRGSRRISLDTIRDAQGNRLIVTQIYSKTMDLNSIAGIVGGDYARVRYLVAGPYVLRNWWPGLPPDNGHPAREDVFNHAVVAGAAIPGAMVGFGFGFGHVWITYGNQKKKDDGKRITEIGLAQPPQGIYTAIANDAPFIWVNPNSTPFPTGESYQYWEKIENYTVFSIGGFNEYFEIDMSQTNNRAIAIVGMTVNYFQDTMSFPNGGRGTDDDVFTMTVRIANTEVFTSVIVAFLLSDPVGVNLGVPDTTDYYQFEFDVMGTAFNPGVNAWSTVAAKRSGFKRVGTNNALNWSTVKGVRITFNNSGYNNQHFVVRDMKWKGGTKGPLSGQFTYVQVDVDNNGKFLEKSRGSAASPIVTVENGTVRVKPTAVSPNANECWTYRYGDGTNGYYLVKKQTGAYGFDPPEFTDDLSVENQLRLNERLNEYQANLPDDVIGIEANWKGRNWYITRQAIYPSIYENPSCYDIRWVLETGSRFVETNYFITRTSADIMVLGTSGDFYQITGTGGVQSQGDIEFFDISIQPMGIKSPPISSDFCVREGTIFYLAADGLRALSGNGSTLLTSDIDLLFKGEYRHDVVPISIKNLLQERYYINVSKNRLYFSAPSVDQQRALYVYNFEDKTWRLEDHDLQDYGNRPGRDSIMAMWVEDDDNIIYGTAGYGDGWIRELNSTAIDPTTLQPWRGLDFPITGDATLDNRDIPVILLTVWDSNQQPRNRKDAYTLKLLIDTGGKDFALTLRGATGFDDYNTNNDLRTFGTIINTNRRMEVVYNIYNQLETCKYFQLDLRGMTKQFILWNWSIDYEPRPTQVTSLRVPNTNYGIAGRKRIYEIPMVIDTLGNIVEMRPMFDNVAQLPMNIQTFEKMQVSYQTRQNVTAFNIGVILQSTLPFEFYEMVQPREIEQLPDQIHYRWVPYSNFGSASRKRFIQLALTIDTHDQPVIIQPYLDGDGPTVIAPLAINTPRKQTVIYTFSYFAVGIELAIEIKSVPQNLVGFEFYGVDLQECVTEKLPPIAKFFHIPKTNFNTSARKRMRQYAFVLDTFGAPVTFKPTIDNLEYPAQVFTTTHKDTCIYTFDSYTVGIDLGGTLESSVPFEFYGLNLEECVYEKLPPIASHIHIPFTNFGTTARKRFRQFGLIIDTHGHDVAFTPSLDGNYLPTEFINTNRKQTYIYTPSADATGIDLGGFLNAKNFTDNFEFYGHAFEDAVYEKLPPVTQFMILPTTNYGIAARKRIRTIPMVINTFGANVKYTPIVDGVEYPPTVFNTGSRGTVLHYFKTDNDIGNSHGLNSGIPFGIDYGGKLEGDGNFEFYELLKPENVETLPVGKKFDQFGPIEFKRVGKIREVSIRILPTGNKLDFIIYSSDNKWMSGSVQVIPNQERTYSLSLPKGVNPNIFRMEISAEEIFHRFDCGVRVNIDGAQTENKWVYVKNQQPLLVG